MISNKKTPKLKHSHSLHLFLDALVFATWDPSPRSKDVDFWREISAVEKNKSTSWGGSKWKSPTSLPCQKSIPTRWFTHNRFGTACFVLGLRVLLSYPSIIHPSPLHLPSPSRNYKLCSAKKSTPSLPNSYSHVFQSSCAKVSAKILDTFSFINFISFRKPIPKINNHHQLPPIREHPETSTPWLNWRCPPSLQSTSCELHCIRPPSNKNLTTGDPLKNLGIGWSI